MAYNEEEFLSLSGIQHYVYCKRQWGLIHIEQVWEENFLTIDGKIFHEHTDDSYSYEKRGNKIISRGMHIRSYELGLIGKCDTVEFKKSKSGVHIRNQEGYYEIYPIEYKRGKEKITSCDEMQVIAQAMCLEEMLCCEISKCYLYYGKSRRRTEILITEDRRNEIRKIILEMHNLYNKRHTPKVKPQKGCKVCSLKDICLPKLTFQKSAKEYIKKILEE